jgi:SNF family Na+-dependent transporter
MIQVSLNIGILVVFYTVLGGVLSYIMHLFFDEHDKEWEKKTTLFQVVDISVELILLGLVGFWLVFYIGNSPPIFSVSKNIDRLVDTYISGIFFTFSLFVFFEDLSSKIRFVYKNTVHPGIKKYFPTKGSILDGTLRKTD